VILKVLLRFRDKLRGICSKHQYNSKEDKDFKIVTPAIILTNENYKVIQIKKNLDVYLGLKKNKNV
jgi:hypothetical protein